LPRRASVTSGRVALRVGESRYFDDADYRVAAEIDPGPAAERVEPLILIEIDLPWGTFIQRRVNRT
jgi:hypothetical protein